MIKNKHINQVIQSLCEKLINDGDLSSPRNMQTLELMNEIVCIENPIEINTICTLKERKLSREYLKAELRWYKFGDLDAEYISKYSSMWSKISDEFGRVNSNYGYWAKHLTGHDDVSQFQWCINQLANDKHSRRAVITYNQLEHKYEGVKDFPCTMYQQFYVRKNKLDSFVSMRSNDLIYGFCYDVPWFTLLQREIAQKLNIPLGNYYHHATSLHVYKKHFKMITEIAKGK
mgnify:CR=1 FL=1|tara:strand:+ start:752 stop:1444 length:693 start_codon:yes stop_codon:yes gene_type:complete